MRRHELLLFFAFAFANQALAQSKLPSLEDIASAYTNFNYQRLDSLVNSALAAYDKYQPDELLRIHLYQGSALYTQGRVDSARAHFAAMLSINPNVEIDAENFSPKIIALVNDMRPQFSTPQPATPTQQIRYIILPDQRPDAAWRSLVLPGWGQRFKGQKTKGAILSAAAAACAASLAIAHYKNLRTHDAYLKATDPVDIENRYADYSKWNKMRAGLLWSTGIVWGYAFFDALFIKSSPRADFSFYPSNSTIAIRYHF